MKAFKLILVLALSVACVGIVGLAGPATPGAAHAAAMAPVYQKAMDELKQESAKIDKYADAYFASSAAETKDRERATKLALAGHYMKSISTVRATLIETAIAISKAEEMNPKQFAIHARKAHELAQSQCDTKLESLIRLGSELKASNIHSDARDLIKMLNDKVIALAKE